MRCEEADKNCCASNTTEVLPSKIDFTHILPHYTWHISLIMSGTPMKFPSQYPIIPPIFSVLEWLCNDRISFIVVLVLQVLEHKIFPFALFVGKTLRIEPATSLLIISRPVVDAITPLWGSRLKLLQNKCYPIFCLRSSISTTCAYTRANPCNTGRCLGLDGGADSLANWWGWWRGWPTPCVYGMGAILGWCSCQP